MPAPWHSGFGYTKNVLSWQQETPGLFLEKGIVERVKNRAGNTRRGIEMHDYKVISTAGDNMYVFRNWGIFCMYYRSLYSANSGIVIKLPSMNTAG